MFMSRCLRAAALAVLFVAAGFAGCGPIPEDPECGYMREVRLSASKSAQIRSWIDATLADPTPLARSGAKRGQLLARQIEPGLDWKDLRLNQRRMLIEFDGRNVDYAALDRAAVGAVIIGFGNGYKLIFKLDPDTDIEARLIEESKQPYGQIKIEALAPDLLLVCQVNRFG